MMAGTEVVTAHNQEADNSNKRHNKTKMIKASTYILATIGVLLFSNSMVGQSYVEVLRYSQKFPQSTARSAALGNAMGALGGDAGAIAINPAGLGVYRTSELMGTFSFNSTATTGNFLSNNQKDMKANLNISNLGFVIGKVRKQNGVAKTNGWVSVNFSLLFNRSNTFHQNIAVQGVNTKNSITDSYAQDGQVLPNQLPVSSYGYLGYYAYLTDSISSMPGKYISIASKYLNNAPYALFQQDLITTRGAANDISTSLGANYSNKLYLGATINLSTVGFHSERTFTEVNNTPASQAIYQKSTLTENVNTTGLGFGFTLGVLGKPTEWLRVGASVSLPTFYRLNDVYNVGVVGFAYGNVYRQDSFPDYEFSYNISTPIKATGSIAILAGKNGLISADLEYIDYTTGRFSRSFDGSRFRNNEIQTVLQPGYNVRFGGEYRIEQFYLRGGFASYSSPYKKEFVNNINTGTQIISFGGGYKETDGFFLDLGLQIANSQSIYTPYTLTGANFAPSATLTTNRVNFLITIGTKI